MKEPFTIISIILAICFFVILTLNKKIKNKIIKLMFLLFSVIYFIFIIILDSNFIYQFLKAIITYIWYPNYLIYVIVNLISIIILIISFFRKEKNIILNIITYLLFSICLASYLIFLNYDIDPTLYSSLYQTKSLLLMRIVTISFMIWILITIFIRMRGKYER